MTFHWNQRQIRVEGRAERITSAESDLYFLSRPRSSQIGIQKLTIGAWVSKQSTVIADRSILEKNEIALEKRFETEELVRPVIMISLR